MRALIDVAAQLHQGYKYPWLQFYWVELISNSDWLKCILLVNDNLVTKGGCLVAALAKSKTHMTFIIVILLMASRTIMESPEQRT